MYIDLSVTLNQQTPVYPGDPTTKVEPAGILDKDGYNDHHISFGNHTGTHIDAPLHMIAGGKTLDQFPIDQFIGPGRLIDASNGFQLESLQAAGIQEGDIVLFRTGMSEHYHEPVYFETYPVMSEEIASYLVDQKVKMAGVDTSSVDNTEAFPIHKRLLGGNVLIIENLSNLEQLADKEFIVSALPIKLDVDGAPARVVAQIVDPTQADQFTQDSFESKNTLALQAANLMDVIDKFKRTSEEHTAYYSYLKDFLLNSGILCNEILQGVHNDVLLLPMVGTRTLLEDAINVQYLTTKGDEQARMAVAMDWFRIANDPKAHKNKVDNKSVKERAYAGDDDVKALHDGVYAEFCNYTHSTAQRSILNIDIVRPMLAKKTTVAAVKAYTNIVMCVAEIVGEDVPTVVTEAANRYFDTYRESVTQAPLPKDESQ